MLYKLKTRKPPMSEGDRLIIAFMVLVGLPVLLCALVEVFV